MHDVRDEKETVSPKPLASIIECPNEEDNTVDLIDEFVKIVSRYIDAPPEFIEAGGYAVVSSLLGPYYRTTWIPNVGRPNLWMILSSIPGRCRRSTIQSLVEFVYRKVMEELLEEDPEISLKTKPNEETQEEESDEEKKPVSIGDLIEDTIIEEGSPEGIIDHIESSTSDVYHVFSTEFGSVLAKMYQDGYEQGTGVLLSKLVYGEGGSVYLSKRGGKSGKRTLRPGLHVDAFSGMQEPWLYITETSIRQGLIRRMLIIYIQTNYLWKPPINEDRPSLYQELAKFAYEFVLGRVRRARDAAKENEKLKGSGYWDSNVKFVEIWVHPSVEKVINDYDKKITLELDKNPSLKNQARQSYWEHLAKLSMCREIARSEICKDEKGISFIVVQPLSYNRAASFLNRVDASSEYFGKIGEKKTEAANSSTPLDRLYDIILNSVPNGIAKSKILLKTKWTASELKEYAETLQQSGLITESVVHTKGRSSLVYKVTEEPNK